MIANLEQARSVLRKLLIIFLIVSLIFKDRVYPIIQSGVRSFLSVFGKDVTFDPASNNNEIIFLSITILLYIGIYVVIEYIIDVPLFRIKPIRRFFLGKYDIEGHWLDVARDGDKVYSYGYLDIEFARDMYIVHGYSYDTDFKKIASWETTFSRYDSGRLEYFFRAQPLVAPGGEVRGCGSYDFTRDGSRVMSSMTGSFQESGKAEALTVQGHSVRMLYPIRANRLVAISTNNRAQTLLEYTKFLNNPTHIQIIHDIGKSIDTVRKLAKINILVFAITFLIYCAVSFYYDFGPAYAISIVVPFLFIIPMSMYLVRSISNRG